VTVLADSACNLDYGFFCEMNHFEWGTYVLVAFLLTIPLCFIENIEKFMIVNTLSIVSLFVTLFLIFQDLIHGSLNKASRVHPEVHRKVFTFNKLIKFFGITSYSMENTGVVFHVRNSLTRPRKFNNYLIKTMCFVVLFTVSMAYFAYIVSSC
jgi:amino acid permease